MRTTLIITVTCPDRPGIVEKVAAAVDSHGGNWEESRMARLGGDFAGIVKVTVPAERAAELRAALANLADETMSVTVKVAEPVAATETAAAQACSLKLAGADHEGIVHRVAAYLAAKGINVGEMETALARAPVSAAPLFRMNALIELPADMSIEQLQAELETLGHQLGVDIELQPASRSGSA